MSSGEWVERVGSISQWSQGGQRAPHKPLLLLYAIGRLDRLGSSEVAFAEAEQPLRDLLATFGNDRTRETPQYPFRRLENDGLWRVEIAPGAADPGENVGGLRESAVGRFDPDFEAALRDADTRARVVGSILDSHFSPSLHDELLAAVGLDVSTVVGSGAIGRPRRDPRFREMVLIAYEYRCSFCGYDGQIDRGAIGIEAAHVRWHAFDGPDTVDNGLSLCTMHHKLLDRGVLGLADGTIAVSQRFVGRGEAAEQYVLSLAGREMLPPQAGHPTPADDHVAWHRTEVFRGPARMGVA